MKHLVFFDGKCGLCDHFVLFILSWDQKKQFYFAPLEGKTAKEKLKSIPLKYRNTDSVILIEDFDGKNERIFFLGKAAFRIFWHLGSFWSFFGLISFLPSFLYDWGYKLIAKNRYRLFSSLQKTFPDESNQDRFLD